MCADVGEALAQMFAQAMCEHESQNVVQCGDFMLSTALLACSPIQSLKMVQRQISLRKSHVPAPRKQPSASLTDLRPRDTARIAGLASEDFKC